MNFELLTYDELVELHRAVRKRLDQKIAVEIKRLEILLNGLRIPDAKLRRRYPPSVQTYRNPNNPSQTWGGRGRRPLWLVQLFLTDGDAGRCKIAQNISQIRAGDTDTEVSDTSPGSAPAI
jgi:hypothetical protein